MTVCISRSYRPSRGGAGAASRGCRFSKGWCGRGGNADALPIAGRATRARDQTGKEGSVQAPPEHAAQRYQHTDTNGALEGEDDEHPFERAIAPQHEAPEADEEEAEGLDAADGATEDQSDPDPVDKEERGPREGEAFGHRQAARVVAGGELFDAEVALAQHELPDFEDEEDRGEGEQPEHGGEVAAILRAAAAQGKGLSAGLALQGAAAQQQCLVGEGI